ncbi:MAG TPA: biotin--[acetyl-CoA-carboxylase] ligase [Blastocatellia bacterium]|nr:biotin--[acetyl-CoA-carboxylase] ligase [Blastocatellia bacterium]
MDSPRDVVPYLAGRLAGEARIYAQLDSTNSLLKELADDGAAEGLVIVADEQTSGRGRHGRAWRSPAGAGLYASVLLRPVISVSDVALLSLAAGLAVADTLTGLAVMPVELKWPNDVLVAGRKICGILAEASFRDNRADWVVLGIGINLHVEAVPLEMSDRATSLDQEGVPIEARELLLPLLAGLGRWYGRLETAGADAIVSEWSALSPMSTGRVVRIDDGREVFEATTDGITPAGTLRVRLADGHTTTLSAGDVTLKPGVARD